MWARLGVLSSAAVLGVIPRWRVMAQVTDELGFEARTYNGTGNNLEFPAWGSVGINQLRSIAASDYSDGVSGVSGGDRPTAREVTTEVFLNAPAVGAPQSALFVAWGLLVSFDIFLNADDETESFDVPCDDAGGVADVWCPAGADSDDIPFFRSQANISEGSGVQNPINLATAYLDLDFVYGRSQEEAEALRTMEDGLMSMSDNQTPLQNDDGTWLIADQRTAQFPVTFALHIMFLLEHNRCCVEVAPDLGYEGDENIYQACRGWTIAVYEHVVNNDFGIRLLSTAVLSTYEMDDDLVSSAYSSVSSVSTASDPATADRRLHPETSSSSSAAPDSSTSSRLLKTQQEQQQQRRRMDVQYVEGINAGADVFATTVGAAAFYSAIPSTVRIVSEDYIPMDEDNIELTEAVEDLAGLFERNGVGSIIRGAVLSRTLAVDVHFASAVSTLSPLFKLPVDAIQRGRDHGVPTYNDARIAYGLSEASTFADVTSDSVVQALLEETYGGDIDLLDAYTGALAEGNNMSSTAFFGDLLKAVWGDQLYRVSKGDRLYHSHGVVTTDAENSTLHDVIERTVGVMDLPLSVFTVPQVSVCYENCSATRGSGSSSVALSDEFMLGWDFTANNFVSFTLSAKYIGEEGYMGIGFGGNEMTSVDDYIICEVMSDSTAECIDRQPVSSKTSPDPDDLNSELDVTDVEIEDDWTSVTFRRYNSDLDDQDYDVAADIDAEESTSVIFAFREGEGVGQHANSNRGINTVDFLLGISTTLCEDDQDFYLLHGALMLFAWMVVAPIGIFYARYKKGSVVLMGNQWWEMHSELMIIATEAVLPLSITAIFSTSGTHNTDHARWGFYMIAAVIMQVMTGFLRQRALEGKHSNFSTLHRINKHFHIWAGHFAFVAGAVQCYRGVALVSGEDSLVMPVVDIDVEIASFDLVQYPIFPFYAGGLALIFIYCEVKKQQKRYSRKGAAMVCCMYELKNENYVAEGRAVDDEEERLMPRTQVLPIYTMEEFNYKVLNGQKWVIVDGAILDISTFSQRHPGGARVLVNALGTDITSELMGEDLSIGVVMSFAPHEHTESAWELARSMVVGYIDEDDETDDAESDSGSEANTDGDVRARQSNHDESHQPAVAQRRGSTHSTGTRGSQHQPQSSIDASNDGDYGTSSSNKNPNGVVNLTVAAVARAWANKARVRGSASVESTSPAIMVPAAATAFLAGFERKMERRKAAHAMFHVCPFVMRERMDKGDTKRPVYRYVFSCRGHAAILVEPPATGVRHVNMRVVRRDGQSVVQRSYNASIVRITQEGASSSHRPATPSVATPAATAAIDTSNGANNHPSASITVNGTLDAINHVIVNGKNGGKGESTAAVATNNAAVPEGDTQETVLGLEMRIRLYEDGAMSQQLEQLAKDPTNAAVQLQGPFLAEKAHPPPGHRNVIMIAAGTGINPMVQLIKDYQHYQSLRTSGRSRLALLWQVGSPEELYCLDELRSLEGKSRGLLEMTLLVSGSHRKTNDPKAPNGFFRRQRQRRKGTRRGSFSARSNPPDSGTSTPAPGSSRLLLRRGDNVGSVNSSMPIDRTSAGSFKDGRGGILRFLTGPMKTSFVRDSSSPAQGIFSAGVGASGGGDDADGIGGSSGRSHEDGVAAAQPTTPPSNAPSHAGSPMEKTEISRDSSPSTSAVRHVRLAERTPLVGRIPWHGLRSTLKGSKASDKEASGSPGRDTLEAKGEGRRQTPREVLAPTRAIVTGNTTEVSAASNDHGKGSSKTRGGRIGGAKIEGSSKTPREILAPTRAIVTGNVRPGMLIDVSTGLLTGPQAAPVITQQSSAAPSSTATLGPTSHTLGKVSRETLQEVFGGALLQSLAAVNSVGQASHHHQSTRLDVPRMDSPSEIEKLCGSETGSGKLQVVVSGPSGFVFYVEALLEDMNVPKEAIVILD